MSETHLAPATIADIDDEVVEAAARVWVENYGVVERAITWAIAVYLPAVVLAAVFVNAGAALLLMPHFWLFMGALLTEALSRRRFERSLPLLGPKARRQIWRVVQRQGPALLRQKGWLHLHFGPAPKDDDKHVPALKVLLKNAHDEALVKPEVGFF